MSQLISIITPSYNQGQFIRDTIESVLNQNYSNFEHIIIDAGSTDSTLDILKEYPHLKWISEKDTGAANAINKGFKFVNGDILTWLNSDDYFADNVFSKVETAFLQNGMDSIVIGCSSFVDKNKNIISKEQNHRVNRNFLIHKNADLLRQPSTFFTPEIFKKVGGVDETLKLVFDYDLFIKIFSFVKPIYIDETFAFQRDYPDTLSRRFIRKQALEIFKVSRRNGGRLLDSINKSIIKKLIFKKI